MKNASKCKAPSESRKIRKPLMERKRRARINDSLETLKDYILKSPHLRIPETYDKRTGIRKPKLEKADILELAVKYIDLLTKNKNSCRTNSQSNKENLIVVYHTECSLDEENFIGNEAKIVSENQKMNLSGDILNAVWRPWR